MKQQYKLQTELQPRIGEYKLRALKAAALSLSITHHTGEIIQPSDLESC